MIHCRSHKNRKCMFKLLKRNVKRSKFLNHRLTLIGSADYGISEINPIGPLCNIWTRLTQGSHLIWVLEDGLVSQSGSSLMLDPVSATIYLKIKLGKLHNTGPLMHIYTCAWQLSDCSENFQRLLADAVWAGPASWRCWNGFFCMSVLKIQCYTAR